MSNFPWQAAESSPDPFNSQGWSGAGRPRRTIAPWPRQPAREVCAAAELVLGKRCRVGATRLRFIPFGGQAFTRQLIEKNQIRIDAPTNRGSSSPRGPDHDTSRAGRAAIPLVDSNCRGFY